MNTLTSIHYIAGVAITAIVLGGFTVNSNAAAKKTTSRASAKVTSTKKAPSENARQIAAKQAANKLTPTQKTKMLALLNEGDSSDLEAIRGIGTSRAAALAKARPFKSVDQLANIRGVGEAVYSDLLAHAKSLTTRRAARQPAKVSTSGKSPSTSATRMKSSKSSSN
jgi:DNA uptake protein ComE-like DNA-binding protein